MEGLVNLRLASILAGASAVLCPLGLYGAGFYGLAEANGFASGVLFLALIAASVLLSGLLAAVGLACGIGAYRRLARPRPVRRKVELLLTGVPALLVLVAFAMMSFFWNHL